MRDFFQDTKDMYECQYGKEICRTFPRYGEFWSKYIGQRKGHLLKHYEIDSSKTSIARFDVKYENMALAHYGVFVDLANIRIDFDVLSKNSYTTVYDVLVYWNAVRNIYSKMGDCIYKYVVFLDYVKDVLNIGKAMDPTINKLIKDLELIKSKRNFITHFTSLPFQHDNLGVVKKIPHKIEDAKGKPLPYSEILKQDTKLWAGVETQIKQDLKEIETKFNECHKITIDLFKRRKKFNIIDPGSVSTEVPINSGTSIKGYSQFISSSSCGASGYCAP